MNRSARRTILQLAAMAGVTIAAAQSTRVSGVVTDAVTGETLPSVNILYRDSRVGTTTDIDGN